jgi:hypothetical protein
MLMRFMATVGVCLRGVGFNEPILAESEYELKFAKQ